MRRILSVIAPVLLVLITKGQGALSSDFYHYHLLDRVEISSGELLKDIHTSVKPYQRRDIIHNTRTAQLNSMVDQFNHEYLMIDNCDFWLAVPDLNTGSTYSIADRNPILGSFYAKKNAFYFLNYTEGPKTFTNTAGETVVINNSGRKKFQLLINPIIGLHYGSPGGDSLSSYRNSRGISMRGSIGGKVGFFTEAVENQYRYPNYIRDEISNTGVIEGGGFNKPFGKNGQDFFTARGYFTFSPIQEISIQFGHDKNFIGNGYRSMILSDRGKEYPFLKINTNVWKLNYQNLFMELTDYQHQSQGQSINKKYAAFHHLSLNLGKQLNIGLFENIIFDRQDSTEKNAYDIHYLNPIIFYRAVEHGLNSTDNALVGLDWKWNFLNHFSFYGQFVFDEFVKNEFIKLSDNYVNKYAFQLGLKYINFANVNNLDLQLELNQARPYVYTHKFASQNWVHYNQELAHPLGANFRETVAIVRYQPKARWTLNSTTLISNQGVDSTQSSNIFGANALLSNRDIQNRNHAPLFQGVKQTTLTQCLHLSYMFFHNFYFDAAYIYRIQDNALTGNSTNTMFVLGFRMNTFWANSL